MKTTDEWLGCFPLLQRLDDGARRSLRHSARLVTLPAGAMAFREGDACSTYMLVLDGSVRVQKVSENGREIVLYRVEAGQSCILTTSCLLNHENYGAEGIAETEVKAVILPISTFEDLIGRSAEFRRFVFSSYAVRISGLLMLIEEVAFGRIDVRLAQFLSERSDAAGMVNGTHQDMAMELGTAREVVSRQLKEFERRGWLALHRGRVELRQPEALREHGRRDRTAL